MEGQAFVLAEKLTDGQPCPVCGSLSHPAPAAAGEDRITEKDVKDAERQMHLSEDAEKKIRHEAEAYQAKELAAAKESADKAMTVLSELEKESACSIQRFACSGKRNQRSGNPYFIL